MARSKLPSKPSDRTPPPDYPEFAVRCDAFDRFFEKPLPSSTFHDLVKNGTIVPFKALWGFYKLNESLCRLGLRPVRALPKPPPLASTEDIIRLAFSIIDPELFPAPSWLLSVASISERDASHAALMSAQHEPHVTALPTAVERIHYLQGVIDAAIVSAEPEA